MKIDIKLVKNFVSQYNKLQAEFGTDIARINGFDDAQLSYTDFIQNFIDEGTVADSSIDSNSNVSHKDVVTLEREMSKPHSKLLAASKIYYEIHKKFGFKTANKWLRYEWIGRLLLHDFPSASFKSYCFAYDLKDLAEKGLYFAEEHNALPAKHLITFVDFIKEFISYASNRTSGAVGLPNLIPYMFYFWKEDINNNYLGIKSSGNEKYYAKQNIQRFIYAVNQTYVRDGSQSAFTNSCVYDRPYFEALFGGATFPNGEYMIDYEEEIIEFQKWYMEEMSSIRSTCMFTFPVSTISLLRQNGNFVDEDFAKWAIKHNMKWSDSNLFVDSTVNSLSNCCFSGDQKAIICFNNETITDTFKNIYNHFYNEDILVYDRGGWKSGKVIRTNAKPMYKIVTEDKLEITVTIDHINITQNGEKITNQLTVDDYLLIYNADKQKTDYSKIIEINRVNYTDKFTYCFEMDNQFEPYFTLMNGVVTHNCRLKSSISDLGYVKMPDHPFTSYHWGTLNTTSVLTRKAKLSIAA